MPLKGLWFVVGVSWIIISKHFEEEGGKVEQGTQHSLKTSSLFHGVLAAPWVQNSGSRELSNFPTGTKLVSGGASIGHQSLLTLEFGAVCPPKKLTFREGK